MAIRQYLGFSNRRGWGYAAAKLSIALIIANLVALHLMQYKPAWIMITIIVVMLAHEAYELQYAKAISRMLATIIGALVACAVTAIHASIILQLIILTIIVFVFLWAKHNKKLQNYTVILGLVTYFMIVINQNPSWQIALERTTEILLGIIISLIVTRFIFPVSSQTVVEQDIIRQWGLLYAYAENTLQNKNLKPQRTIDAIRLEKKIITTNKNIQQLISADDKRKTKRLFNNYHSRQAIVQFGIYRYLTTIDITTIDYYDENTSKNDQITTNSPAASVIIKALHALSTNALLPTIKAGLDEQATIIQAAAVSDSDQLTVVENFAIKRTLYLLQGKLEITNR